MMKPLEASSSRPRARRRSPAAVCLLDGPRDDGWMQMVASEMNLPKTAFLTPEGDGFRLRWFAPKAEVDLCGHATLACAHVLWEEGILASGETARFDTKSGSLTSEKRGGLIEMNFPAEPERPVKCSPPMLEAALGAPIGYVGDNRFALLVELDSEEILRDLETKPLAPLTALLGASGSGRPLPF